MPDHATKFSQNKPELMDWLILIAIIIIGGSSFSLIRGAVDTIPPAIIAAGRLWIGAIFMLLIMYGTGRRFPPILLPDNDQSNNLLQKQNPAWYPMIICGFIGNAIPFFLFAWAQQFLDSGLAGIYMALMPIWTLALAAFFVGEHLSGRKLIGFIFGFSGVIILMGPEVISGAANTKLTAQLALILATLCYAASAVITRRTTGIRPRVFAAGMLLWAAIFSIPSLIFIPWQIETWSMISLLCLIGLGLFPTGLAGFLLVIIIQRVGAGFMSYSNYLTPVWAVILGAIIYHERLPINALIALIFASLGLAISQSAVKKKNTS